MGEKKLSFEPGTGVEQSATNFLLLTEVVGRVSGMDYESFVKKHQFERLGLRHTGFTGDLDQYDSEDVSQTGNIHQLFKMDGRFIDPVEQAASYRQDGSPYSVIPSTALRGFGDVWASAQDISFWDIGLAGGVLIEKRKTGRSSTGRGSFRTEIACPPTQAGSSITTAV